MDHLERRPRLAARIVLLDEASRILLFDTQLAYTRTWLTPGGALNPGETWEQGALRELWEETGLTDVQLSPCVWTTSFSFRYEDLIYDQVERYFVVRCNSLAINKENWEETERAEIREYRWWSIPEIADSDESFRPAELAALLQTIAAGEYPDVPSLVTIEASAITLPAQ